MHSPSQPSECVAALTLNDGDENRPYLSIFYSVIDGAIHFFGVEVVGTEQSEGEDGPVEKLVYYTKTGHETTNPDEARVLIEGTLNEDNEMRIMDCSMGVQILESQEQAVNYIQVIRYVYTMASQGVE